MTKKIKLKDNTFNKKVLRRASIKVLTNIKLAVSGKSILYSDIFSAISLLNKLLPAEWKFKASPEAMAIIRSHRDAGDN